MSIQRTFLVISFAASALAMLPPGVCQELSIIPLPAEVSQGVGKFQLNTESTIFYSAELANEALLLQSAIKKQTEIRCSLAKLPEESASSNIRGSIQLLLYEGAPEKSEGYSLHVSAERAVVTAADKAGIFWGTQSLRQLISDDSVPTIPACTIRDWPRFSWRGVMLDVGRYMYSVEDIKELLDWMALYKLNVFHWHLTEDQGWRIEIKKYPKLTTVGAWRDSSPPVGEPLGSDGVRYGGFYSQEEIRDLVEYARQRHITILPEIDMPGHMAAAIASYPELGNDDVPDYEPAVATTFGTKPYILSPKEETFEWIDDVLEEVCELFPSKYIHIGGDEAIKDQWEKSPFAQSVIKREGLQDEHELQAWFIRRVESLLEKRGRRLIGWEEIREGGLSPGATVMAWRSWGPAEASAREGHDVILSPQSHTYFDYYQTAPALELAKGSEYESIGGYLPLAKVLDFDPMPRGLTGTDFEHHVLGCQAQLWTEFFPTWREVQYMTYPRVFAFAEKAWSPASDTDIDSFVERLQPALKKLEKDGIKYYDPQQEVAVEAFKGAQVTTSLPGNGESVPEYAYDGDSQTYFWSSRSPNVEDFFQVSFSSPIHEKRVVVFTGATEWGSRRKTWGGEQYSLENGVLEASVNGEDWEVIGEFAEGNASGNTPSGCLHIRIRPTEDHHSGKLVIHEIQIKGKKSK